MLPDSECDTQRSLSQWDMHTSKMTLLSAPSKKEGGGRKRHQSQLLSICSALARPLWKFTVGAQPHTLLSAKFPTLIVTNWIPCEEGQRRPVTHCTRREKRHVTYSLRASRDLRDISVTGATSTSDVNGGRACVRGDGPEASAAAVAPVLFSPIRAAGGRCPRGCIGNVRSTGGRQTSKVRGMPVTGSPRAASPQLLQWKRKSAHRRRAWSAVGRLLS